MEQKEYTPTQIIGGYQIQKKIGKGSFGTVYSAHHKNEKGQIEWYALKAISKDSIKNPEKKVLLNTEISVAMEVESEYLIMAINHFETGHNYIIVYQYCEFGSLESHLSNVKENRIKEELAIKLIRSVILGYKHLYDKHILHRDIKPENICIKQNKDGEIYALLGDFGFAKLVEGKMTDFKFQEDNIMGTLGYISPEVICGNEYNYQCDIFSIGVTFYSMLFGRMPFVCQTPVELKEAHTNGTILFNMSNIKVSKYSLDFILMCLQYNPDERMKMKGMLDHPLNKKSLFDILSPINLKAGIIERSIHVASDFLADT